MISRSEVLSPAEVIRNKYIEPTGLSATEFAKQKKLSYGALRSVLDRNRPMKRNFVRELCKVTKTEPRYWYELELHYLYERFFKSCGISITPIESKLLPNLRPPRKLRADRKTNTDKDPLRNFTLGKRKINISMATRLASRSKKNVW